MSRLVSGASEMDTVPAEKEVMAQIAQSHEALHVSVQSTGGDGDLNGQDTYGKCN